MLVVNRDGLMEREYLSRYDATIFPRPSVTVDMLIFTIIDVKQKSYRKLPQKKLGILMVKRGEHPFINSWALPGGFVKVDESLDEAAKRELTEETNISGIFMEQLYTWGDIYRDPRTRVISVSYIALVDYHNLRLKAGTDTIEAEWFFVDTQSKQRDTDELVWDEDLYLRSDDKTLLANIRLSRTLQGNLCREVLKSDGIAFDHGQIISHGIEHLRNRVRNSDIVFNLMPPLFSLTELQKVYEVVLDRELAKANFRRKVAPMVQVTSDVRGESGFRPSKLYRYNPTWWVTPNEEI